jgi:hypothetical protein
MLGADAIARAASASAVAGAALALGVAASGGHPGMTLLGFAAFALAIAAHALTRWRRPAAATALAARGLVAFGLGLMFAAPTLLPLVELSAVGWSYKRGFVGLAMRNFTLDEAQRTLPLALFAPATLELMRPDLRAVFPYALGPAIGVMGLVAAVAGVVRGRLGVPLAAVALFGLTMTTAPPGLTWVGTLPGLAYLIPGYAWPLVVLPLTQAAGAGVALLRDRRLALLALAVVLAGAGSLLLVADSHVKMPMHLAYGTVFARVLATAEGKLRLVAPLVVAALVAVAAARLRWPARVVGAVAIVELALTMSAFTRLPPSTVLGSPPTPAVRFLRERLGRGEGRMVAVPHTIGAPITSALFEIPDLRGVGALPVERYWRFLNAITPRLNQFTVQKVAEKASPLLDVAGVRYVVVARDLAAPPAPLLDGDPEMPLAFTDAGVVVYENRAALPRVRVVRRVAPASDVEQAEALMIAYAPADGTPPRSTWSTRW